MSGQIASKKYILSQHISSAFQDLQKRRKKRSVPNTGASPCSTGLIEKVFVYLYSNNTQYELYHDVGKKKMKSQKYFIKSLYNARVRYKVSNREHKADTEPKKLESYPNPTTARV